MTTATNTAIEPITNDNRRPGHPQTGYLVRYDRHDDYGWMCTRAFATWEEAEAFAASKE